MFSEFNTGCIDINRMYRISDRVIAIQMAIDGADFMRGLSLFLRGMQRQEVKHLKMQDEYLEEEYLQEELLLQKMIVYLDGLT